MIKAIIFDYYGVMCPRIALCLTERTAKQFNSDESLARTVMEHLLDLLDENSISFYQYWKILKSKLGNKTTKLSDHEKIWKQCTIELKLRPEMVRLVLKLRKSGYKTPLLTNVTKTMVKYNRFYERYKFFKPLLLSCDIGLRKPSPAIFRYTLKKLKLKPEECLFIDDQQNYLEGAHIVGMKTILFKNYSQLLVELKRFGIDGI